MSREAAAASSGALRVRPPRKFAPVTVGRDSQGSAFSFDLPFEHDTESPAVAAPGPQPRGWRDSETPDVAPQRAARPLTVLVAEDNPVNQRLATAIVKGAAIASCWLRTVMRPLRAPATRRSTSC
jgi:hypothetical protein